MITRQGIVDRIASHASAIQQLGVQNIGIFGSFSRNEQYAGSDIDFLVSFQPQKETFDNFMALYDFLEELFSGYTIDVVSTTSLSEHIGPYILKEVFYV